jgi:hypothetical protein
MRKQRIHGTNDWIDLKKATKLARWKHRPGGASYGMIKAVMELYRTDQGSLVMSEPGWVVGLPFYAHVPMSTRFRLVNPEDAVQIMVATKGQKQAEKLFPDLVGRATASSVAGRQL